MLAIPWQHFVEIFRISFLLSVDYIHVIKSNSALYRFSLQQSCKYPFFSPAPSHGFRLFITWKLQFQNTSCRAKGGMSIEIVTLLASTSASSTDLERIQTLHSLFIDFGADKSLQLVRQAAELKSESKFEPLLVIWQSLQKAIPEINRTFDCKVNGRALVAALQNSLYGSDGQAQKQGVSESAAVAGTGCGPRSAHFRKKCYRSCNTGLVRGQTRFFMLCKSWAMTTDFIFHGQWNFDGFRQNLLQSNTDQSRAATAHCFAQSCNHTLVCE